MSEPEPGAGRTILIAEDSPLLRDALQRMLEQEGFVVLLARDGEEAVSVVFAARPDLVVMDLMLPGIDGAEAALRLRTDPRTRMLPIVAITASVAGWHSPDQRAELFDEWLPKPFTPKRLLRAIQRFLPAEALD